ncbi:hypothetical protein [Caloramator sp. Dgby_cultured_2]|uniref:hypothetical protein n=1 Tax=Caloramator sp. Dgby_cultured_2 TaxID=3029174 RepID=UPI00237E67C1|nr:hypothetical protein [Caloramator sp. Dgby_cultured_2]WDU84194.1 hypothetical protein PWK10_07705 [Caloramator sp. Dgby_cultured_2]
MAYTKETISDGQIITSAWGNKIEKGISEAHQLIGELTVEKSGKDSNGIYTQVDYKRKSTGKLYMRSVLSGGTSPNYTTRTVTVYDENGTTVLKTLTYTITYDSDGNIVSMT